jgi:adenine-specific DNA-methyltransferase
MNYNRIIQGDCASIMKTVPDESIDLVLTDPPYGVSYRDRDGRAIANDDNVENILGVFNDLYRALKPNSFCISFYGWSKVDLFFRAWTDAGFRPVGHLVWHKNYASASRYVEYRHEQAYVLAKGQPSYPSEPLADVQPWQYTGNKCHPTEKAVSILSPLVKSFSRTGEVVLDPFSGSGSTSVAAALCGRRYLGIELDAGYCDVARRRLQGVACYNRKTE